MAISLLAYEKADIRASWLAIEKLETKNQRREFGLKKHEKEE